MVRLVMILLGVDYLRTRWLSLRIVGCISVLLGVFVFVDALDSALIFPSRRSSRFFCSKALPRSRSPGPAWADNARYAT
jgi:hypothetical protein